MQHVIGYTSFKMGPIICPETSEENFCYMLHNVQEEYRSYIFPVVLPICGYFPAPVLIGQHA